MGAMYCPEQHHFYRELGKKVRTFRKASHLSLEELANQSDVSRTTITSLERGNLKISVYLLLRVLMTMGIPAANLDEILVSIRQRSNGKHRRQAPTHPEL